MTNTVIQPHYVIRTKVFKIFGGAFHVYDPNGNVIMYSKQKAFKLREDIRVYNDESMQRELLTIQARRIVDFSAAYDVIDPQTKQKLGALQRKGMKSIIRDEWLILDAHDREIGLIQEDSTMLGLIRRFVEAASMFFPQKYHATVGGVQVCTFKQNFNPFVKKLMVMPESAGDGRVDRRVLLAAGILLAAIEGRQT